MKTINLFLLALGFLFGCLPTIADDCSGPSILLNAFDSNFEIQRNLRAQNIKVEVDHKEAKILSLSLDTRPRRIVLMVDTSGSMEASSQQTGWGITLPTAAYAVDAIPADGSSALVTFSDKLHRESNSFEDRKVVGARVLDLARRQPKGKTSLFDSIHQVLGDFPELRLGDVIYVVTDGDDNRSITSLPNLEEELITRGVRVFVFLIVRGGPQGFYRMTGASYMDSLAESTGGEAVRISSFAGSVRPQLDKVAALIINQVQGVYRLELGVSQGDKAARVKVQFVARTGSKNITIEYSRQTAACSRNP